MMMPKRAFVVVVVGLVLAIGQGPHEAGATKVKSFVDYSDVMCDGGKVLKETTADTSDECYQLCKDKKKCKAAQYYKADEKCVLLKKCKTWKRAYGSAFAGRVSKKTKYYKAPGGFYCGNYNCERVGVIGASSTFKKCLKRCDKTSDCKHVEWDKSTFNCRMFSSGMNFVATTRDYIMAKKKKRTP